MKKRESCPVCNKKTVTEFLGTTSLGEIVHTWKCRSCKNKLKKEHIKGFGYSELKAV